MIAPGTRLGPYVIAVPIGSDAMGKVYRATDTNLRRQVAITVLPDAFADDPERRAGFEREANKAGDGEAVRRWWRRRRE